MDKDTPNAKDPLSEPTLARRIWAAYLSRGWNRAEWARMLGANYNAVQNWDLGKNEMSLHFFSAAVQLLGYSADELLYGKKSRQKQGIADISRSLVALENVSPNAFASSPSHSEIEAPYVAAILSSGTPSEIEAIRATMELSPSETGELLESLKASCEARSALAKVYLDPERYWIDRSANFVRHFVRAWDSATKLKPEARLLAAINAATNAANRLRAIALDGHAPRAAPPAPPAPPTRQRKRTPVAR